MTDGDVVRVGAVVARSDDPAVVDRLGALERAGRVEVLALEPDQAARRRLRATTDRGTVVEVALARDEVLVDGAVLVLEADRAVLARVTAEPWLVVEPADVATALAVGHLAGHHHWRVQLRADRLAVAAPSLAAGDRALLEQLAGEGRLRLADRPGPAGPPR